MELNKLANCTYILPALNITYMYTEIKSLGWHVCIEMGVKSGFASHHPRMRVKQIIVNYAKSSGEGRGNALVAMNANA